MHCRHAEEVGLIGMQGISQLGGGWWPELETCFGHGKLWLWTHKQSSTTSNLSLFPIDEVLHFQWWCLPTGCIASFLMNWDPRADFLTSRVFRWEIRSFGRTKCNVTICCFQVICLQKAWVVCHRWCLAGSATAVLYSAAVAAYETVAQWPFALDLLQAIPALPGRKALMDI